MLVCEALWVAMNGLIKELSESYPPLQLLFFRNVLSIPLLYYLVRMTGGHQVLKTNRPFMHLIHSLIGSIGMICLIIAIGKLTLSETVTITYAAPLFITIFSVPFLGEKVGLRRWLAVVVGFVGVLIVARPDVEFNPLVFLGIFATFCFSITVIIKRILSRTENSATLTLYFCITGTVVGAIGMLPNWVEPRTVDWGILIIMSLIAALVQITLTMAIKETPVSILSPLLYLSLVAAVIIDIIFWGVFPATETVVGAGIIIFAGLFIIYRERKNKI